jgi:2-oxoglutarate ferredoxin oxidoreductase subunit alpha
MGLAIMTELPLVIVNSQRGGPSTGLPTKTEQSDLYQAFTAETGDAPMPVIAARSPADAFDCAIEACRIATQYMTPVMLLTDGYIANAAEPWRVPDMADYQPFPAAFHDTPLGEGEKVNPYARDEKAEARLDQAGTPGLTHRIGGIEKNVGTGHIDYGPENHQAMTDLRAAKVLGVADSYDRSRRSRASAALRWRSSAGAPPMARSRRRCAAPVPAASMLRTSTSATSGRFRRTLASCCARSARSWCRR